MNKVNGEISGFTLPNNVTSKNVKSLVIDAGRNLWISTFRGGLDLYDSRQNKATITNIPKRIPVPCW